MTEARTSQARILILSTLGLALGYSTLTTAPFGVLVGPLGREFGWQRGDISFALSTWSVFHIFMSPVAGLFVDRNGVRSILLPSILLFGLTFIALSYMSGPLWQLYLGYAVLGVVGVGASPVCYSRLVVSWFTERRGLALGVTLSGVGLGLALLPLLVQTIVADGGWRLAYRVLGGLIIVVMLPLAARWAWYRPAQRVEAALRADASNPSTEASGLGFGEAIRSKNFILLAMSFGLLGMLTGAVPPHLVPILTDRGVSAIQAALFASALGFSLIAGRLTMGFLMDRFFAPPLMIGTIVIAVVGLGLLLGGGPGFWAVFAICCVGFTTGGEIDFMSYLVSRYIGLTAFSRIFGLLLACFAVGQTVGSALMGFSAKYSGTYDLALGVLICTTLAATVPPLFLGRYRVGRDAT